jgi:hypothetical protein
MLPVVVIRSVTNGSIKDTFLPTEYLSHAYR